MKKVNPNFDVCENYTLDIYSLHKALKKGAEIKKGCWSCRFNLFARCWLEEYNKNDKTVIFALDGNQQARQTVHLRIT